MSPPPLLGEVEGDYDDLGLADLADSSPPLSTTQPSTPTSAAPPAPEHEEDLGPAHAARTWRQPGKGKTRPPKVTAGIRSDITAKISLPLEISGRVWEARDPLCGGVFVKQRPDIAEALTEIVCDSPDLIRFFTGPAGGFMKYLNLGAALWPVAEMIGAHHVYHSVSLPEEDRPGSPEAAYRA